MVSFSFLGVPLRSPLTGDAQSSFPAEMVAMMGGWCGVERGSRGRWRKPLRILVHGKGPEGRSVEWRSGGAGVGGCRLVSVGTFLAALPRAMVPTMVGIVVSGCERSVTGARIAFIAAVIALIDVCRHFVRRWTAERRDGRYTPSRCSRRSSTWAWRSSLMKNGGSSHLKNGRNLPF